MQTSIIKNNNENKQNEISECILGIDVGSLYLRAAVILNKTKISEYKVSSNGVQYGFVTNTEEFERDVMGLLAEISEDLGEIPRKIVVGMSTKNQGSVSINSAGITGRSDGTILQNDIDECVRKARLKMDVNKNNEIIHTLITKKRVDDNVVIEDLVGMHGYKIEIKAFFIHDDSKTIKNIYEVFENLGLNIQIVSGTFAESLISLNKKEKRLGGASLNIGEENTTIAVYENNYPVLISAIPFGGETVTSDLSLGLRLPYVESEETKINLSRLETAKRRSEDIVEARINFINNKINSELDKIKRRELLPCGINLTGGSSLLFKIEQYMRYDLKIPVNSYEKNINSAAEKTNTNNVNVRSFGIALLYDPSEEDSIYLEYIKKAYKYLEGKLKKMLP